MRKIYVRGDGNEWIGMGHLMRLMTITDQLKKDASIEYVCADEKSAEPLRDRGYSVNVLNTDSKQMEEELPVLLSYFQKEKKTWDARPVILVDGYFVTASYLKELGKHGYVFYLDDMMQQVFPVDGIINYNCFADSHWYKTHYAEKLRYVGAEYVPLRQEFSGKEKSDPKKCVKVLITTGGGDYFHIAREILKLIYAENFEFHLVLGRFAMDDEELNSFARNHDNVILHRNVKDMASLMQECNLGITAGGSTVYEMCAMGLPMIVFSYAENQEKLAEFIGRREAGLYAGAYHKQDKECLNQIKESFLTTTQDKDLRIRIRENALHVVDGHGVERLAAAMLSDCKKLDNVVK